MRPSCRDILLKADLSRSQSDFHYYIITESQSSICCKMATRGRCLPSIFNGKFFKFDKIDGDKVTALCTHCPGMKSLSGYLSATTNFLTHLKVWFRIFILLFNRISKQHVLNAVPRTTKINRNVLNLTWLY